jgi:hypothetical protein
VGLARLAAKTRIMVRAMTRSRISATQIDLKNLPTGVTSRFSHFILEGLSTFLTIKGSI